ncbi:aminotransferase class I/II-fold pyridoxal phosphate-dependent enzyme [Ruoffia tabacinasalis]|uniref:Histidinol-phosphate aminotransferase family protein n=1 Tax=Ruoffia tabacinasalis TaxID=87458 RepID=A0ABS0LGW1_9LACT|nr:histidinol-phosphate transaminase [Ruoffia tabacinasalis]MBG9977507.1 histidinol-phosphate aminotransferase family protein [Ruoffia tabacinasalis]
MIIMNRNTSPISPIKKEYMDEVYNRTVFQDYPDVELGQLKAIYAKDNNLNVDEIELASGADEWIQKTFITLGQKGIMTITPDFFMYKDYAEQLQLPFYEVESEADYSFDFDKIVKAIYKKKPSLFILSNPHNPTGLMFKEDELQAITDAMEAMHGYFVIDEAYIEFGKEYARPDGGHVLIIRTLSKIYGLAGLRIGIIIAKGETYDKVTRINHPYPLDHVGMNLASIFLEDKAWVKEYANYQLESRGMLVEAFKQVNQVMSVNDSYTNFVFTYGERALSLGRFLEENGFSGRFYEEDNLKETVRYSIIKHEDYPRLNGLIEEWLKI